MKDGISRKDDLPQKICRECQIKKPREEFSKNQFGKNNRILRRPVCKECYKKKKKLFLKIRKEYEKENPRPIASFNNPFFCPICHRKYYGEHKNQIVLDHSHHTGKIRGWICGSCNASIGKFKEDVNVLKRAIQWLKGMLSILF